MVASLELDKERKLLTVCLQVELLVLPPAGGQNFGIARQCALVGQLLSWLSQQRPLEGSVWALCQLPARPEEQVAAIKTSQSPIMIIHLSELLRILHKCQSLWPRCTNAYRDQV